MFLLCLITPNISMTETMPDVHISSLVGHPKFFPIIHPKSLGGGVGGAENF